MKGIKKTRLETILMTRKDLRRPVDIYLSKPSDENQGLSIIKNLGIHQ